MDITTFTHIEGDKDREIDKKEKPTAPPSMESHEEKEENIRERERERV